MFLSNIFPHVQHVGCDYRINSDAIEDRCGVCHGDGRSCEMVTDEFTEESGIGKNRYTIYDTIARRGWEGGKYSADLLFRETLT